MDKSNVQRVSDLYAALASGDAAAVLGALEPDVVWNEAESIPYADRNPYVGPQQVAEGVFGRLMNEWEDFAVTPEEIVDGGEKVVVLGRYRGKFKATGLALDAQFAHVWTLRDGRITRFQQYADTDQFTRVANPPTLPLLA